MSLNEAQRLQLSASYQRDVGEFVGREVHSCVSELISHLCQDSPDSAFDYFEELMSVCVSDDYESAAYDEGWRVKEHHGYWLYYKMQDIDSMRSAINTHMAVSEEQAWRACCDDNGLEPHQREAYEHWIVSDWLAGKLEAKGEMVSMDIHGLTVWGRCTSGQAILLDGVICEIFNEAQRV